VRNTYFFNSTHAFQIALIKKLKKKIKKKKKKKKRDSHMLKGHITLLETWFEEIPPTQF